MWRYIMTIKQAKKEDITPFMKMCAQVFKATYTNKELGIPPENFNYDLFMSAFNREYFEPTTICRYELTPYVSGSSKDSNPRSRS